jgi:hypothetical protein
MQDITEQLQTAKGIIQNLVASHQATGHMAARHALRVTDLPKDILPSLLEHARKVEEAEHQNHYN